MKNAQFDTLHIRKICHQKLGIDFEATKETNGAFYYDERKIYKISVPKGRKTLPAGTYAGIARQLKISIAQFDELLACPLSFECYIGILKEKGVLPPRLVNMKELKKMMKN